jgi:hypothetical protein
LFSFPQDGFAEAGRLEQAHVDLASHVTAEQALQIFDGHAGWKIAEGDIDVRMGVETGGLGQRAINPNRTRRGQVIILAISSRS